MAEVPNLFDIPIDALKPATKAFISMLLNPVKVLPNDDGLPRDWRGLAHLTNMPTTYTHSKPDPTMEVLKCWTKGTLGLLLEYFGQLDRWDVADDSRGMIEKDAIDHAKVVEQASSPAEMLDAELEKQILTVDDAVRIKQGLGPQHYNAYLLYTEEDQDFALKIVDEMETNYDLKLCLRDRNLIGGVMFEHEAIMKLISERCNRLIVIVSPNFIKSEANKFFVTFAQALGIDQKRRKVIPVLYERCSLPLELSFYFLLDYTRSGHLWNFWDKLYESVKVKNGEKDCYKPTSQKVPEIKASVSSPKEEIPENVSSSSSKIDIESSKEEFKISPQEYPTSSKPKVKTPTLNSVRAKSKKFFSKFVLNESKKEMKIKEPC